MMMGRGMNFEWAGWYLAQRVLPFKKEVGRSEQRYQPAH